MSESTDFIYHYMVNKENSDSYVDMNKTITSIMYYVQNNEVYFDYEINFVDGVMVFGIVGYTQDHIELQKKLGNVLKDLGCVLKFSTFNKLADK